MKDGVAKSAVAYLGGVLALALIAQCSPAKSPTEPQPQPTPTALFQPTGAPPTGAPTPTPTVSNPVAGTYRGTETKQEDTCGGFSSTFTVTITVDLNGSTITLTIRESATFISSGILRPDNSFNTTGSFSFGQFAGTESVAGQINGNVLSGTDTRDFNSGCPGKRFVGNINVTKP